LQARNDKQHLRILLDELGPPPAQVPRKDNRSIDLALYSRWEMPIQDITTALMAENNVTQNDILYLEAKSIFVQLIRSIPRLAERRPIVLPIVAEQAATAKDATLVRKGIKVKEMLREMEELRLVDRKDNYKLLTDEVANELVHLGNLREKVVLETRSLDAVYKTICDHNSYLRSQLEQYKAYLQNVRQTSAGKGKSSGGVGVVTVAGKDKQPAKSQTLGPFKFTHQQFEKDGVIMETNVPENRCVCLLPLFPSLPYRPLPIFCSLPVTDELRSSSSCPLPLPVPSSSPSTTKAERRRFSRWTSRSTTCLRRRTKGWSSSIWST
jgi:Ras GTPase-activating-like protein IQGAP2/3